MKFALKLTVSTILLSKSLTQSEKKIVTELCSKNLYLLIIIRINLEMLSRGEARALWVGILIAVPSGAGVALSVLGGNAGSLGRIISY